MAKAVECDPRVDRKAVRRHFRGLKGPDIVLLYVEIRRMLFSDNPRKVSRELAEHDRQHPEANLRLKI